jgi:lipopolysaccharide/colanic/teichoic acid biosynthesis glycosyltransferase/VanZ family protein
MKIFLWTGATVILAVSLTALSGVKAGAISERVLAHYSVRLTISAGLVIVMTKALGGVTPVRETQLRAAFVGTVAAAAALAGMQSIAVTRPLSIADLVINTAGAFVGVLALTGRWFGLVELNTPPSPEERKEVERRHALLGPAPTEGAVKRLLDILVSVGGIVASAVLWPLIALFIWCEEPGPILFAKVCVGRGGRSFLQLKFRSMVKNAEGVTGPVLAATRDSRVLRAGLALRRTALDELPQLWNILRGDMSFVGPRPQRTVLVLRYLDDLPRYAERHLVRPGLTGVAQVYGHYYVTPEQKLRFDLFYLRHRGLLFDVKLFVKSLWISVRGGWQNAFWRTPS